MPTSQPDWQSDGGHIVGVAASIFATLFLGVCYLLWVGVAVFRQISEVDKVKGTVAKRFAFLSWLGLPPTSRYHIIPFQAVVIGPRSSGKTNLFLFALQTDEHPDWAIANNPNRRATTIPCACRYTSFDKEHDVSAIDTGGENLADQFSIMRQSRIDLLVVVINAKHLVDDVNTLAEDQWVVEKVGRVFNEDYVETVQVINVQTNVVEARQEELGESSAIYFKALHLTTKGATGAATADPDVPAAHSILIVLNTGDAQGPGQQKANAVNPDCLLALARSLSDRFPVFDEDGKIRVPAKVAAWIVNLGSPVAIPIRWTGDPNKTQPRNIVGGAW
jgi:hypothetical protein